MNNKAIIQVLVELASGAIILDYFARLLLAPAFSDSIKALYRTGAKWQALLEYLSGIMEYYDGLCCMDATLGE